MSKDVELRKAALPSPPSLRLHIQHRLTGFRESRVCLWLLLIDEQSPPQSCTEILCKNYPSYNLNHNLRATEFDWEEHPTAANWHERRVSLEIFSSGSSVPNLYFFKYELQMRLLLLLCHETLTENSNDDANLIHDFQPAVSERSAQRAGRTSADQLAWWTGACWLQFAVITLFLGAEVQFISRSRTKFPL